MFNLKLILYKAKLKAHWMSLGNTKTDRSAEKLERFMIDSKKVAFLTQCIYFKVDTDVEVM